MKIFIDRDELVRVFNSRRAFYCDETPESFRKLDYSDKCRVDMLDSCIADVFNMPKYKSLSEELEDIKAELNNLDFDFGNYYDETEAILNKINSVLDKHIKENKQ